jgi:hypothetical protein
LLHYDPVDFTFAALLFEYVAVRTTLRTLRRNSRPDAILTTVLQLPHPTMPPLSDSPYESLGSLTSAMILVPPETLCRTAADVGFVLLDATVLELPSGKRFCVQNFRL